MGFKDSLIGMVGDFVQMKKNPEFRSKTELSNAHAGTSDNLQAPQNYNKQRRHSLNITVGAEGPPDTFVRPRTYSVKVKKENRGAPEKSPRSTAREAHKNRRFSAPSALKLPKIQFEMDPDTADTVHDEDPEKELSRKLRKMTVKKQVSKESSDSDDSDNDYQKRKMAQNSPRFNQSGFFRPGSFREAAPIEEEPENESYPSRGVTVITTRF